jgi:hypothetical protein
MRPGEKLAKPKTNNWETVSAWATAEIVTTLQENPEFTSTETLRNEFWLECRLLRENHIPVLSYSLIGKILGIDKGTFNIVIRYETVGHLVARNGRPPLVPEEHREELIQWIEEAYYRGISWRIGEILELM